MSFNAAERRPLILGEVLFDVMPGGERVLGGAPFNVAWHLQAFGLSPLMVTRVGSDDSGKAVREAVNRWGMDPAGIQSDPARPTGQVKVELDSGEPTFHILADQAYDHIDHAPAAAVLEGRGFSMLYHGSLVFRSETSRATVGRLAEELEVPVFVDVNLRPPWFEIERISAAVRRARWLKLNEAELHLLADAAGIEEDSDALARAEAYRQSVGLQTVVLTMGSRGAAVLDDAGVKKASPPDVLIQDTVGAGDALTSVMMLGLQRGWSTRVTLDRAVAFAAAVCSISGATTSDRSFYSRFAEKGWL